MFSRAYLDATRSMPLAVSEAVARYGKAGGALREEAVVSIWLDQPWGRLPIRDVKGRLVEIISPGWRNHGPGPDLKDAVFRYRGKDIEKGDAEVHVRSSDWIAHGHGGDPAYDNTRLHIVLYCDSTRDPRMTSSGRSLIELELGPMCAAIIDRIRAGGSLSTGPGGLDNVTGDCGAKIAEAGAEKAGRTLDAAGEGRMLLKSRRFAGAVKDGKGEDALYEGLCEALGYSVYKRQFGLVAKTAPLGLLRAVAGAVEPAERSDTFEAVFFGVAGLAPGDIQVVNDFDEESRKYFLTLRERWERVSARHGITPLCGEEHWPFKGTRPANYPMRRLAGLARFLAAHIGSDLAPLFHEAANKALPKPGGKRAAGTLDEIMSLFPAQDGAYWERRFVAGGKRQARPSNLISRDRVTLYVINTVIPYFLAKASHEDKAEEERRLKRLYHMIPAPSTNSVVEFMRKRLFGGKTPRGFMTAVRQQGLIQIYNDFCSVNPAGCRGCRFASGIAGAL